MFRNQGDYFQLLQLALSAERTNWRKLHACCRPCLPPADAGRPRRHRQDAAGARSRASRLSMPESIAFRRASAAGLARFHRLRDCRCARLSVLFRQRPETAASRLSAREIASCWCWTTSSICSTARPCSRRFWRRARRRMLVTSRERLNLSKNGCSTSAG